MGFFRTVTVFSVGYLLGARAGRKRYEQIKTQSKKIWNSEPVIQGREKVKARAMQALQGTFNFVVANVKTALGAAIFTPQPPTATAAAAPTTPRHSDYNAEEIVVAPLADYKARN